MRDKVRYQEKYLAMKTKAYNLTHALELLLANVDAPLETRDRIQAVVERFYEAHKQEEL
jgi:hypothetical protein